MSMNLAERIHLVQTHDARTHTHTYTLRQMLALYLQADVEYHFSLLVSLPAKLQLGVPWTNKGLSEMFL